MRNPERIPEIMRELEKVWQQNPDFRFTQLIIALTNTEEKAPKLFYLEDEELLKAIKKFDYGNSV